jgi:hypothetical protein
MARGRALFAQDPPGALAAFEESIALAGVGASALHSPSITLDGAAQLRARMGDRPAALAHLRTAIVWSHDAGGRSQLGMTVERAVATLASTGDDDLAATCAGIVQSQSVTTFRALPQIDRTAARVADRLGADAYQTAVARGAALTYPQVAPTLLAQLDALLTSTHPLPDSRGQARTQ